MIIVDDMVIVATESLHEAVVVTVQLWSTRGAW